jgi:AbrB family looped-hinge helix DNA binding protein
MALARSKITAQGQISVPLEVRRRLGVGPGTILEWTEQGDSMVVRRAGTFSSEEIHRALFPDGKPAAKTVEEMDDGIRKHLREKHARR